MNTRTDPGSPPQAEPLSLFLPAVARWFRSTLGEPTAAQRLGWPAIARGEHTLILAPTGSGKTLAAFLACLDHLWRQPDLRPGIQVLYVSPLKALNNDIHRNLQTPLEGVARTAWEMGQPLPELEAALRTGDTPAHERQRISRRPPHILITTPESLNLILTSQARDILRGVRYAIIDEIHALCPNKRGVFLALLLERLENLNPQGFVRIGLSATQRPLQEVARYLAGDAARNVTIVDAGLRKDLDLRVVTPVETFGPLPERSIWPSIYRLLLREIGSHRSTIVFANNRRTVERITTQLNEFSAADEAADEERQERALRADSASKHAEQFPFPPPRANGVARAHHGSVSLEVRQQTEQALKEGRLPAVVATASLELGIDMGAVDLVCQVESPGSVSRALQRVGRAGHLVGARSQGRLIAKTLPDLLEQAVLAREMRAGRVEAMAVPKNSLDVLAQQIVAMVAADSWSVPELFALVRQAYPYRDLTPQAFESVLEMVSGRYPSEAFRELRPRISWDRIHNRLHPLPGSKQLALVNGGAIPDTGQYAAYLQGQEVRIGELDEEFVYERRIGDTFVLGTSAWRIEQIEADRVYVSRALGVPALMPFWRGEKVARTRDLGLALGRFLRELAERLPRPDCLEWLQCECHMDPAAARNLRDYVRRQIETAGALPTDQTLLVEAFRDSVGDWHVAVLSPFGARFNLALRLALEARLRDRLGYRPQCLHHDDGLLLRLADVDEPPLDLLDDLDPAQLETLILGELADSALFAIRFRHNAARALLMPRTSPGQRAPLWLQRLKARSLLQVARQHPEFPVVVETYRECLEDHLDVPRLQELLAELRSGQVQVVKRRAEAPSPFAASLLFGFTAAFMYDYDRVEKAAGAPDAGVDRHLLDQILAPDRNLHLLDPRAVHQVERRLRGLGHPPRTVEEMAEWLRRLGDLAPSELEGQMPRYLEELRQAGRAVPFHLAAVAEPERWILAEEQPLYQAAFGSSRSQPGMIREWSETLDACEKILRRFLLTHALVGLEDVLGRYPLEPDWTRRKLEEWTAHGQLVSLRSADVEAAPRWAEPANLDQVQRGALALARREVLSCPPHQFADFLLRWQYRHPATRRQGIEGLGQVLQRLQALPLPAELWEQCVLPGRVEGYLARWLDELGQSGAWLWFSQCEESEGAGQVAFLRRDQLDHFPAPALAAADQPLDSEAESVYEQLRTRGASFALDLAQGCARPPTQVRQALWRLLRRGLATNDRFDVLRRGEENDLRQGALVDRARRGPSLRSLRRRQAQHPEGRWALLPWGTPETEARAVFQACLLLERYGVVSRELAALDSSLLPWRVLYEVLSRMEWAGEVRRGYFVEGLSGAQFALPEAAQELAARHLPSRAAEPVIVLNALDPANIHAGGAIQALSTQALGERGFARRAGNWLALRGGQPILLIENHGKRLWTLPATRPDDLALAVAALPEILRTAHGVNPRGKISVEEWDGLPIANSPGRELLEASGFVRDYHAWTFYAAWGNFKSEPQPP